MKGMLSRIIRAARLDSRLYEEVEADRGAIGQAMTVVVLASIAGGIGSGLTGLPGVMAGTLRALLSWFVWAGLTWVIGAYLLPEARTRADLGELLRTVGFASAPGLVRVLGLVPGATTPRE